MSDISKTSGDNFGGIKKLFYAIQSTIDAIIDIPFNGPMIITQAQLDDNFSQIHFITQSANHDQVSKKSSHGKLYNHGIECRVSGENQDIIDQIDDVGERKICCIYLSQNDVWYLVPKLEQNEDTRSGKKIADTNGTTFVFKGTLPTKRHKLTITA